MGLLENAQQAAQLRTEQNRAAAISHRLMCEERDLGYARQWWHERIAEPAQFWLPRGWSAYGDETTFTREIVITADGWPFMFRPHYREMHYEQPRDVAFVIIGIDQWNRPKLYGTSYLHRAEISDLASLGRALTEATEKFGDAIEELSDRGYGELMLEGRY